MSRRREIVTVTLPPLLLWAVLVFGLGAGGPRDFWFEDDPDLVALAGRIDNPIDFFIQPELVQHTPGQAEVIPMLFVSLWLDAHLASLDGLASFAMMHSALATLAAALLLAWLLRRWFRPEIAAGAACLWLLLPSTQSTLEFVSTRCYQEGLIFALLALLCVPKRPALMLLFTALAMLSKEMYLATLPTALAFFLLAAKQRKAFVALCALCLAIAAHRIWAVGLSVQYSMALPGPGDVVLLLRQTPRLTLAVEAGNLVWAILALAAAMLYELKPRRRAEIHRFLLVLATAWLTLLPVTHALLQSNVGVTTWSRSWFAVNTLMIVAAAWVFRELRRRWMAIAGAAAVLALAAQMAFASVHTWNALKQPLWIEAKFMFERPDAVILTKAGAGAWYFPGLASLYHDRALAAVVHSQTDMMQRAALLDRPWFTRRGDVMQQCAPQACLE